MKKLAIIAVVIFCFVSGSLGVSAQFRYGAVAGATLNNLVFKQDLVDVDQQVGYQAGVVGELMFPGIGVGIDLGVLYNQQGALVKLGQKKVWSSLGYGSERVMLHNINIPVHLRLKYTRLNGLEEKIAPIVYGGPEFNIQVGHTNCSAFKCSGGDLGLTCGIGAELFRKWQITGSYTWGMTYALKTRLLDDFSATSRQWTVRVVRFF